MEYLFRFDIKMQVRIFNSSCDRSSRPEVFSKTGVLTNFAKVTGKHLF